MADYICPDCEQSLEEDEVHVCSREEKTSTVYHPPHYNHGNFEVIDVIEDWNLDFHLGNAVKYIARAEHKGKFEEDIKKAIWYLQRRIDK